MTFARAFVLVCRSSSLVSLNCRMFRFHLARARLMIKMYGTSLVILTPPGGGRGARRLFVRSLQAVSPLSLPSVQIFRQKL